MLQESEAALCSGMVTCEMDYSVPLVGGRRLAEGSWGPSLCSPHSFVNTQNSPSPLWQPREKKERGMERGRQREEERERERNKEERKRVKRCLLMLSNSSWGPALPLWRSTVEWRCSHDFLGKKQLIQSGEAGWNSVKHTGFWAFSRSLHGSWRGQSWVIQATGPAESLQSTGYAGNSTLFFVAECQKRPPTTYNVCSYE